MGGLPYSYGHMEKTTHRVVAELEESLPRGAIKVQRPGRLQRFRELSKIRCTVLHMHSFCSILKCAMAPKQLSWKSYRLGTSGFHRNEGIGEVER